MVFRSQHMTARAGYYGKLNVAKYMDLSCGGGGNFKSSLDYEEIKLVHFNKNLAGFFFEGQILNLKLKYKSV